MRNEDSGLRNEDTGLRNEDTGLMRRGRAGGNALIEFLSDLYGSEPFWDKAYEATKLSAAAKSANKTEAAAKPTKTSSTAVRATSLTK